MHWSCSCPAKNRTSRGYRRSDIRFPPYSLEIRRESEGFGRGDRRTRCGKALHKVPG